MGASVSVGPGHAVVDGTGYKWSFVATVNGVTGIDTFWWPTDNLAEATEACLARLEKFPGSLEGIT